MAKNKKNPNPQYGSQTETQERDDRLELRGIVEEALPSTLFRVRVDATLILCTLGGKLRINRIRILPGDAVTIEVSPYDMSKGRITWRGK